MELDCLPDDCMTLENQTKLCKDLSREGCCTYQFGASIGKQFPFRLFLLLDDRALAPELEASCRLIRDKFSDDFIEYYKDKPGGLTSDQALHELSLIVMASKTATVKLETQNAQIRRQVEATSLQSARPELPTISGRFVLRKASTREARILKPAGVFEPKERKRGDQKPDEQGRPTKRGGGGAWRAFIAARARVVGR
eukprot:3380016-Pyramimonas_sp.AAC.1